MCIAAKKKYAGETFRLRIANTLRIVDRKMRVKWKSKCSSLFAVCRWWKFLSKAFRPNCLCRRDYQEMSLFGYFPFFAISTKIAPGFWNLESTSFAHANYLSNFCGEQLRRNNQFHTKYEASVRLMSISGFHLFSFDTLPINMTISNGQFQ